MIKIRPHHLLDIIRDFGNGIHRPPHPWGASVESVTQQILSNPQSEVEFVLGIDSICETCSRRVGDICEAQINENLLMRDYNDGLDRRLFSALNLTPGARMSSIQFLQKINQQMDILDLFTSPSEQPGERLRGTTIALRKLGVMKTE